MTRRNPRQQRRARRCGDDVAWRRTRVKHRYRARIIDGDNARSAYVYLSTQHSKHSDRTWRAADLRRRVAHFAADCYRTLEEAGREVSAAWRRRRKMAVWFYGLHVTVQLQPLPTELLIQRETTMFMPTIYVW